MPSQKVLEREIPTFLNLLTVTVGTGLDLRQSLVCLRQSSHVSCPRLVDKFSKILESARIENTSLDAAFLTACERKENAAIANLIYSFAHSCESRSALLSHLEAQKTYATARQELKNHKLIRNYLRRWLPHLGFLFFFVSPMIIFVALGPALWSGPMVGDFWPSHY